MYVGTKEPLDWKRRVKSWLKIQYSKNKDHGIWSHHFIANRWETMETVADFIFGGSKITADGDCSHKIKRHLLLGRKAMTNLDSLLKIRDITLPTKVHIVKGMAFPAVTYGCEKVKVAQVCPMLCDPMDYTVHRILQAKILEWVASPFSRAPSQPRDQTQVSHIVGGFFTSWATREVMWDLRCEDGCEDWTIKKAEHQRIDAFELWCWEDSWESLGLQGDQINQF